MTTEPNDPRVTRALEAFGANDVEGLRMFALNNPMVREAMARALDAANEPLPVRDVSPYDTTVDIRGVRHTGTAGLTSLGSCGVPGCLTHPPVWQKSVPRHARGQQVQRVVFDETPIMPNVAPDPAVSRETVDATNFTRAVLNAWEKSVPRETPPNALERLRSWRRRAR